MAARDGSGGGIQPARDSPHVSAGPQRHGRGVELEGVARAREYPVVSGGREPGAVGVAVVRPRGDKADTCYLHHPRRRTASEPDRGAGHRVQLASGYRAQCYLVPRDGHAPVSEDDGGPLAGHRVVGEALDGDLAGLRPPDTRVINPDHVRVSGDGAQHGAGRPEILPVETEECGQLPRLPEARRIGGGIGDSGREGEGG